MSTLAGRSEARRRRALELLDSPRYVERWNRLGPAEVVGSVRHGLVVAPDIETPEQRHAILELKEALVGDADYRAMDVYRAVVDGGADTVGAFRRWRREHGSRELIRWAPDAGRRP